jgi:ABC-type dipeptide/oligopeptide/nickel transport system permease subunit
MSVKRIGVFILIFYLFLAIAGPKLITFNPSEKVGPPFSPPGGEFRLGTNDMGHDLFSELIAGARVSLLVGLVSGLLSIFLSTAVGLVSGWYERSTAGSIMTQFTVFFLTLPLIPLVVILAVFLPGGPLTSALIIGLTHWAAGARVFKSRAAEIKENAHILSLRAMGAGGLYLISRHAFRMLWPLISLQFINNVRLAILAEAALSFLGLGSPTVKSWGTMLYYAQSRNAMLTEAWLGWIIPPGIMIAVLCLGLTLVSYGLEPEFDRRIGLNASRS